MTKFRGFIGINRGPVEVSPGIFKQVIEDVEVSGEIRQLNAKWSNAEMRDTLSLRHVLSIVTPEDSLVDFTEVVYVVWQTRKWSVTAIQYKRPRIELSLGGFYNG